MTFLLLSFFLLLLPGPSWLIGYKAWGMFVAKVLSAFDVVVILPDYRNFPQGTVGDMLTDLDTAFGWIHENIEQFGGDKNSMFVMGQSAGAHLALLTVLRKSQHEHQSGPDATHRWRTSDVPAVIGIAGPYNVHDLQGSLNARGLSRHMLNGIMEGRESLKKYSADYVVTTEEDFSNPAVTRRMPPVILLHGTADTCVPHQASRRTAEALASADIRTFLRYYPQKSHTDSIIEDLVYAEDPCKEDMMTDIATIVLARGRALAVLPKVSYEIGRAADLPNRDEPPRRSNSHYFSQAPNSSDDDSSYSSSEEFEVHVDSDDERLRPSFLRPAMEKPHDFDLKKIRWSIMPWILWRCAKLTNPF